VTPLSLQWAARYYYLQRLCFGGRVKGRVYGTAPMHAPRINLLRMEEEISAVHLRLVGVTIEHLPWEDFVRRYDKPGTLFYCDPPYYKAPFYEHNLELADYKKMAAELAGIKGKFILSINDHPDILEVFGSFRINPVSLKYTVARRKQTNGRELLVSNF
jgi:DNA adenine methylase